MLFLQPMPMDEVAAANRPVAAEVYTMKVCRTHTAAAWNDVLLAQAPGTPGSPAPNQGSGSLLEPPGSPADVPPPRPNSVNNGASRSPFDTTTGSPNDPGKQTPDPAVPEPVPPDATPPGAPTPTTTPPTTPPPIDDTKAPDVPTPTGTGGTSGPMQSPPNQTPAPSSADPGATSATPAPSTTTPPASPTTPPAATPPAPTDMGASGTR